MQFIGNRYDILDYNGEIEVGKLYKARDAYSNNIVYVKLINNSELINEIDIVWASSDPSVATVNENGIITGISEGTAIITGTFANQSQNVIVTINPAYQFYLIWALFIIIFFILTIYFTRRREI